MNRKSPVPTPLEIAILLTVVVLFLAVMTTSRSVVENLNDWGEGLWSLLAFMTQMCLILLGGYVVAASNPVSQLLKRLALLPKTNLQTYLFTFFVSALACWINWGLGLVVGAFFSLEIARQHKRVHFPLVVSTSYMGFLFWHGGLSGSIPLTIGTPGNFSEQWMGELIGFDQTVFSSFNMSLILALLVGFALLIGFLNSRLNKKEKAVPVVSFLADGEEATVCEAESFFTRPTYWILCILMGVVFALQVYQGKFSFSLNQVNFLLILAGLVLHAGLRSYLQAVQKGCNRLAPILVQYPLYAGIMGIMINSGLAVKMSNVFVGFSTDTTFPLYMFWSAGLVNLFVPSGGGQWAVQAPIVIEGAKALNVPLWKAAMAVAWGDAWTNLAQPFWALPLLSIVGLGLKDIMSFCLQALLVSGLIISAFFLLV